MDSKSLNLDDMKPSMLKKYAREIGVHERYISEADDEDDLQAALIELIDKHQRNLRLIPGPEPEPEPEPEERNIPLNVLDDIKVQDHTESNDINIADILPIYDDNMKQILDTLPMGWEVLVLLNYKILQAGYLYWGYQYITNERDLVKYHPTKKLKNGQPKKRNKNELNDMYTKFLPSGRSNSYNMDKLINIITSYTITMKYIDEPVDVDIHSIEMLLIQYKGIINKLIMSIKPGNVSLLPIHLLSNSPHMYHIDNSRLQSIYFSNPLYTLFIMSKREYFPNISDYTDKYGSMITIFGDGYHIFMSRDDSEENYNKLVSKFHKNSELIMKRLIHYIDHTTLNSIQNINPLVHIILFANSKFMVPPPPIIPPNGSLYNRLIYDRKLDAYNNAVNLFTILSIYGLENITIHSNILFTPVFHMWPRPVDILGFIRFLGDRFIPTQTHIRNDRISKLSDIISNELMNEIDQLKRLHIAQQNLSVAKGLTDDDSHFSWLTEMHTIEPALKDRRRKSFNRMTDIRSSERPLSLMDDPGKSIQRKYNYNWSDKKGLMDAKNRLHISRMERIETDITNKLGEELLRQSKVNIDDHRHIPEDSRELDSLLDTIIKDPNMGIDGGTGNANHSQVKSISPLHTLSITLSLATM